MSRMDLQQHNTSRGTAMTTRQLATSKHARSSFANLAIEMTWLLPKFEKYRPDVWYAGVCLLVLRLLQTSVVVFVKTQKVQGEAWLALDVTPPSDRRVMCVSVCTTARRSCNCEHFDVGCCDSLARDRSDEKPNGQQRRRSIPNADLFVDFRPSSSARWHVSRVHGRHFNGRHALHLNRGCVCDGIDPREQ